MRLFWGNTAHDAHSILRLASLGFLVLAQFIMSDAFAAGTPAGTTISNQAFATYRANNGTPMPPISSNVVDVTVQQLGAVNITPATATRVTQINTTVDYPSTVTNSGNGTDNILLAANSSLGFATSIYRDANGDGGATAPADNDWGGIYDDTHPITEDGYFRWANILYDSY